MLLNKKRNYARRLTNKEAEISKWEREELFEIFKKVVKLQKKAEAIGIFIDDRDLLHCSKCGLKEDVDAYGRMMTYYDETLIDTGLRFKNIRGKKNIFHCPRCKTKAVFEER